LILHITNGDSAAIGIVNIQPGRRVLPWRDLLHEGPVPAGYGFRELSAIRAQYLFEAGYTETLEEAQVHFRSCEAALRLAGECREIVLWFEHDLYDQLQLAQVLDWFRENAPDAPLRLVQTNEYLGEMLDEQLARAWKSREPVHRMQLDAAHMVWEAIRAPHPTSLGAMARSRFVGLPYLAPALLRFCAEYPSTRQGLSRTEEIILALLAEQPLEPGPLFEAFQRAEEPRFLGDLSFFRVVGGLQTGPQPLLDQDLRLTAHGRAVLEGSADRIRGNGIDRWLGGVHLSGADSPWRWDVTRQQFVPRRS
jgi:hypothetical protein